VGNGHTIAAITFQRRIIGLMEHHTQLLNAKKIERLLVYFADGDLRDEELLNDG